MECIMYSSIELKITTKGTDETVLWEKSWISAFHMFKWTHPEWVPYNVKDELKKVVPNKEIICQHISLYSRMVLVEEKNLTRTYQIRQFSLYIHMEVVAYHHRYEVPSSTYYFPFVKHLFIILCQLNQFVMLCDHDPCNEISSFGHHWGMCYLSKHLSTSLWLLFSTHEIELFTHIEWGKLQPLWERRRQGKWMKHLSYRVWAYTHSSGGIYYVYIIKVVATSHSCDLWLQQFSFILDRLWWMTN